MEILKCIKYIHPTLKLWSDYDYTDLNDWEWARLVWHNIEITQPTQAELETAWAEYVVENEVTVKLLRMKEIRREIIALWYTDELPYDARVDNIISAKKDVLVAEWEAIKTEVDATYDAELIDEIINSLFS